MSDHEYEENMMLALAVANGGRIEPWTIARRRPGSPSRLTFERLREQGCLDSNGNLTAVGRERVQ